MPLPIERPADWDTAYQNAKTPWDLGKPAPALVAWLAGKPTPGRVAVPGCGRGHDALALAEAGFEVTGIDFAPTAIATARETAASRHLQLHFEQSDFFALGPEHTGAYDYVFEHTCYCAIPPERRDDYVATAARLLKPGGKLVAVFFTHKEPGGPPFATTEAEVRERFGCLFDIAELGTTEHSVRSRRGEETFGVLVRRNGV
ncbi:MAG TPA: methyltransferase domain-containing protein [Oscillatoriaceae cyanobacterium]